MLGGRPRADRPRVNIVVLQAGDRHFGLVVDAIEDTAEIVVKPLGRLLKHLSIFAGATIMGDGRVALILDVVGLAARGRAAHRRAARAASTTRPDVTASTSRRQTLLLFALSGNGPTPLPLSQVARLEEFSPRGHRALRHRDGRAVPRRRSCRSCDVAGVLERGSGTQMDRNPLQVVVYHPRRRRSWAWSSAPSPTSSTRPWRSRRELDQPGLAGSAVVSGRVTDVVDVRGADRRQRRRRATLKEPTRVSSQNSSAPCGSTTRLFGVDVLRVQEVIRAQPMTGVPRAAEVVRGLINLRGQIVTAIDLRNRLQLPPRDDGRPPMNVVVRTDDGPVSLLVDEIGDVIEVDETNLSPPPRRWIPTGADAIGGVLKLDDTLLLLLDVDRVVEVGRVHRPRRDDAPADAA